ADPSRSLSEYSLLSKAEKKALLVEFNHTDAPKLDKNVVDLFEEQVDNSPDAIALRYQGETWTYAQLNVQANQLANYLSRRGVGLGEIAALFLDRSPEVIVAILGVLKAGAGYMPIDTGLPAKRIAWMLEETQAPVILTSQNYTSRLPESRPETVYMDQDWKKISVESGVNLRPGIGMEDLAYIIYTSGSTGKPKGAMIRHSNLLNYISWAKEFYLRGEQLDFPLFSSLSFDLTVTSIFVPMVSGGSIVVYPEEEASGLTVLDVFEDNLVDIVKLTPAHLALIKEINPETTRVRKMIVGGEDFKRSLAVQVSELFNHQVEIYNEYGPTEATVGCMIHKFDPELGLAPSVPIGQPINNTQIYVLDQQLNPVPTGVIGEMCIGGASVAKGYFNREELTAEKFIDNPFKPGERLYRTGDLARWTEEGRMQFLGRADHQVKIQGFRVELGEIESSILDHPAVESAVVTVIKSQDKTPHGATKKCTQCGLPDNYPGVSFDAAGVCNTCRDFNVLKDRFDPYFKTPDDLREIFRRAKQEKSGKYDCIVLYSGGKDSSYMLYQLVETFGATPLVFSIDNGYISEEAKVNIRQVTEDLGVDLVFGKTPHMNAIFVDSLKRQNNVCDGCFKVIYTLSINLAREKGIKYIFTGLTRGQLFETRLSDMFQARIFDPEVIDQTVLAARKAYHRFDDAVSQLMDVKVFEDDHIFDDIQLVDFYRYTDVPLQEMYQYLEDNAPWVRPSDSGRSTNCLINDVGIYIHKKERGYHNYALPYSWDVRMGHKTREEALDDLDDDINEKRVHEILAEIRYDENEGSRTQLAAYYVPRQSISSSEIRDHIASSLPAYMLPSFFIEMDQLPLTQNGKIDRQALPLPDSNQRINIDTTYVAPESQVEKELALIWGEVLNIEAIGIHDNFFEIGGDSIATIQVTMRISQAYQIELRPVALFNSPTIAQLAFQVEDLLLAEIEMLSDEEAELLLDLENETGE
ncbi:MAG: amino acid adenylation domain-containing protein, partial [Anaerolineales bacterium]|nr:amino acid adenylation domain-containing protein [Anaerolineales bacterium]